MTSFSFLSFFSFFFLYFSLLPCSSFLWPANQHTAVRVDKRLSRKFDESDFINIKVDRPLGLDLEEVDDGVFRGVYIADYTKNGNAEKALKKEFLTPTNLFIVKANGVDLRNSNFDTVMDAIMSVDGEVGLTLIDPNAVIKGTAVLEVTDGEGRTRQIKCLKGQRLRTVLIDNNIEVQDPKASNCGGGGICGTCMVEINVPDNDWSEKPNFEMKKLKNYGESCRLSCNCIVEGDARVLVKPRPNTNSNFGGDSDSNDSDLGISGSYRPNPDNVV